MRRWCSSPCWLRAWWWKAGGTRCAARMRSRLDRPERLRISPGHRAGVTPKDRQGIRLPPQDHRWPARHRRGLPEVLPARPAATLVHSRGVVAWLGALLAQPGGKEVAAGIRGEGDLEGGLFGVGGDRVDVRAVAQEVLGGAA